MDKSVSPLAIASRYWTVRCPNFYVESLPGKGGCDWGYTTESDKALHLTPFWQRRFANCCRRVGVTARFTHI